MSKEIWKSLAPEYPDYEISNHGRLKNIKTKRISKKTLDDSGYIRSGLTQNGITKLERIHILVAKAFIPNSENKPEVDHIDRDKSNARVENLRWVTKSENAKNRDKFSSSGIPLYLLDKDKNIIERFEKVDHLANKIGISNKSISTYLGKNKIYKNKYFMEYAYNIDKDDPNIKRKLYKIDGYEPL